MADDILIVDDEADIRELVSGILQDEGYITRSARDSDDALAHVAAGLAPEFWRAALNSLLLAAAAAILAVGFAVVLAYARRQTRSALIQGASTLPAISYAVPGTVLAIGLVIPLAGLDSSVDALMRSLFGMSTGLVLSGTAFAIVLAYTIRFLAASLGAIEAGLSKVSRNIDAVARTLGATIGGMLVKVHLPLLRPALGAAALFPRRLAAAPQAADDFFIFVHAAGGWDVTLWADPRNERRGIVEPASTDNTDIAPVDRWKSVKLDADTDTFEILAPSNVALRFGPGIGALYDFRDRLTVINGLAMNTVSHPDGTAYSATGRHLAGGLVPASSVDVAMANERGTGQLLPAVAIQFPSSFVGDLDRRAVPLRVANAATVAKSLTRSDAYLDDTDRSAIARTLADEAGDLAKRSVYPEVYERIGCPTLALRGAESDLMEVATLKAMAERGPKAQTVEFAGVGHAPVLMDPDQIAVVRDFLLAG